MNKQFGFAIMAIAIAAGMVGCAAAEPGAAKPAGDIVFARDTGGGSWSIWTINADGKDLRQLISGAAEGEMDVDPMFSPDGKQLLFTSTRGKTMGMWVANADGSDPKRLCDGREGEWSPDGSSIVMVKSNTVVVRELASGKEKQLLPAKGYDICVGPAWSPDGKTIGFAARSSDTPNALYLVPATGGEPTQLYKKENRSVCQLHWAPNGQRIVFETETNLATIQPDGKKYKGLTYDGGVQRYGRWSPDGANVVYCQGLTENGPWELYIVPAAGGTSRKLTEGASDLNPDWRPASKGK